MYWADMLPSWTTTVLPRFVVGAYIEVCDSGWNNAGTIQVDYLLKGMVSLSWKKHTVSNNLQIFSKENWNTHILVGQVATLYTY